MQSNSTVYVYIVQQEDSIKFGEKMAAETVTHRQMFVNRFHKIRLPVRVVSSCLLNWRKVVDL